MNWADDADTKAGELLSAHAAELYAEAERIAMRARAGSVSSAYVDEAAFTIRIRRPGSALPDLLLAIGIGLVGIAGGVLAVVLTEPSDVHLKLNWVGPAAIGMSCIGFLISGIGGALKLRTS